MYTALIASKALKLTTVFICLSLMLTIMINCVKVIKKIYKNREKEQKLKKSYICIIIKKYIVCLDIFLFWFSIFSIPQLLTEVAK